MYKPPLITNYMLLYESYMAMRNYPKETLPQLICVRLQNYLRQSKYFNRLTDDALQTKTQNLLSGQYNPDEPIDVFLYPPHDPYTYRSPYTTVDVLKTALYLVSDPVQSLFRNFVIHDLVDGTYTVVTADGVVYRPTELSFLDYDEPISIKTDSDSFKDYLNNASNSIPIDLTDTQHLATAVYYKIVLLNLDKIHDAPIDPSYTPFVSTRYITDDNDLSVDDTVANPITDDLLDELNDALDDTQIIITDDSDLFDELDDEVANHPITDDALKD